MNGTPYVVALRALMHERAMRVHDAWEESKRLMAAGMRPLEADDERRRLLRLVDEWYKSELAKLEEER